MEFDLRPSLTSGLLLTRALRHIAMLLLLLPMLGWAVTPMVSSNGYQTCALTTAGVVNCWGWVRSNISSTRVTPGVVQGLPAGIMSVAVGESHACALTLEGAVKCWGWNDRGQLGDGTTVNRPAPVTVTGLASDIAAIAAGAYHTCALTTSGGVKCWGWNNYGQIGDATFVTRTTATNVSGLISDIALLAAGWEHTCALTKGGGIKCWGYNGNGQLGDMTTGWSRSTPVNVSGLNSGIVAISAGFGHTCALTATGGVKCWGDNSYGMLGDNSNTERHIPGDVSGLTTGATAIAAGYDHTCVLVAGGKVKCWGYNGYGALGDGTNNNQYLPVDISSGLGEVTSIAAGLRVTCAMPLTGGIKCWGYNNLGQLGDGTTANSSVPSRVLNESSTGFFSLTGESLDGSLDPYKVLQIVGKTGADLNTKLTDLRATGFSGEIYLTSLLPRTSPLVRLMKRGFKDAGVGMVPMSFGRTGYKQYGPTVAAEANATGSISAGSQYTVYEKQADDPLTNSNAVICMGVTVPEWSAKGQVLMRAIATGDKVSGIVQCPTVQTPVTTQMYSSTTSGPITARTITATISPLAEQRGQTLSVCSWAVAPNGEQYMQTPNGWAYMTQPMQAARMVTVPQTGSIAHTVTNAADLSTLVGTLAYIGLGSDCEIVQNMNMAGHHYTVQ